MSPTPLAGMRVLVPRAENSAAPLVALLSAAGADVTAIPLIAIEPPDDTAGLDSAVLALAAGDYDWVGFASANAVRAVTGRASALGVAPAVPADTRVAAVGPATATALRAAGLPVDLLPAGSSSAAGLAETWPQPTHPASRVLWPSSAIGLPTLPDLLSGMGYLVDRVPAYAPRSLPVPELIARNTALGRYAAILLTSPSIVSALVSGVWPAPGVTIGCIGHTTAAAARHAGLQVGYIASDATLEALVDGLITTISAAQQETGAR